MRVAAQLYTVRDFTATNAAVKNTLKRIREIGYDAVQISGFKAYDPDNIADALKKNGLTVCATHTPLDRILNETDAVIAEHLRFGAKYVGLGFFRGKSLDEYAELADKLEPVIEKINAAGLRFLYHNHNHELMKFGGVSPIAYFAKRFESGKFDFLPDFYWLQTAGYSPEAFLREYAGRTPVVHFKDMRVPPAEGMTNMAEIFEGNMDYGSIYETCLKLGVEWAVIEQDTCDGDPFDSLKLSLDNMHARKMFLQ